MAPRCKPIMAKILMHTEYCCIFKEDQVLLVGRMGLQAILAIIALTSLLYYFCTRRFKRKNPLSHISNINYASDVEAAKIKALVCLWSRRWDSNPQPPERQSSSLASCDTTRFIIKEETMLYISIKLPTQIYPVQS